MTEEEYREARSNGHAFSTLLFFASVVIVIVLFATGLI